jgi:hypothetical protein
MTKTFEEQAAEKMVAKRAAQAASLKLSDDANYCRGEVQLAIAKARIAVQARKATMAERVAASIAEKLATAKAVAEMSEAEKALLKPQTASEGKGESEDKPSTATKAA